MPQIELEETDHQRIIRLHKKNGWYSGNRLESAELPGYLQVGARQGSCRLGHAANG